MKLYNFYRNSAGWRVRIVLALKGLKYDHVSVDLRPEASAQRDPEYLAVNPQGLIPALVDGRHIITQSLAIIDYLDEKKPRPRLLPRDAVMRARVRAFAQAIVSEMHPLNNARVLAYLGKAHHLDEEARKRWYHHWIAEGFRPLEKIAAEARGRGPYCFGKMVTLADVCLVPQWDNARRWGCDLTPYPTLAAIVAACEPLPAFQAAAPESQPGYAPF